MLLVVGVKRRDYNIFITMTDYILKQIANNVGAHGIELEKDNKGIPISRGYWGDGKQEFYLRLDQNTPLTDDQRDSITQSFPMIIGREEYYLDAIDDMEKDDDRIWRASFSLLSKKY